MFTVYTVSPGNEVSFQEQYITLEAAVLATSAYAFEPDDATLLQSMFIIRQSIGNSDSWNGRILATGHFVTVEPNKLPWLAWNLPNGIRRLFKSEPREHRGYEVVEVK